MRPVLLLATLLFSPYRVFADDAHCDTSDLEQRFDAAKLVILVHVTDSTFPGRDTPDTSGRAISGTAKLLVVRSWKGALRSGDSVMAGPPNFGINGPWIPYRVYVGDEVLVFADVVDPVWLDSFFCKMIDVAHAGDPIAALDSLVKARAAAGPNQRLERR